AVGATDREAPVGPRRERRPNLLPADDPLVAVQLGTRLYVGEVGAGVGLGVALAPQLLGVHDRRQEPLLLLLAAERDHRRPEEPFADDPDPPWAPRARVLLVEDDLARERQPASP